jgi:hypothetical protein
MALACAADRNKKSSMEPPGSLSDHDTAAAAD